MKANASAWRNTVTMLLAAFLLPLDSANAKTWGIRADNDPAAVAAVKKLELQLCDLLVHGNWHGYAGHLTDDYVRVLPGKVQDKAEVLNEFRTSIVKTTSMVPEKIETRIYGDTAIAIIDLYVRTQTPTGAITENHGRGTKVFVRRKGKWYLAQLTGSPR